MKAVVTVIGHDTLGIISKVSAACAEAGANIIDITQSVLREYFAMINAYRSRADEQALFSLCG